MCVCAANGVANRKKIEAKQNREKRNEMETDERVTEMNGSKMSTANGME